jgi:hypothetical protein
VIEFSKFLQDPHISGLKTLKADCWTCRIFGHTSIPKQRLAKLGDVDSKEFVEAHIEVMLLQMKKAGCTHADIDSPEGGTLL